MKRPTRQLEARVIEVRCLNHVVLYVNDVQLQADFHSPTRHGA